MRTTRTTNKEIMETLANISATLEIMNARVCALETPSATSKKSTTKKATKSEAKKSTASRTTEKATLKNMTLADFEPKKYDGFYRWGNKKDGFNQKSYMGMRKAYCVYKATNGQYLDSQKAYDDGVRIDYSEDSAYFKAKAEFEKKFKYIKKADR